MSWTLAVGLAAGLAPAAEDAPSGMTFEKAAALAKANVETAQGKQYDSTLAGYATEHYPPLIGGCVKRAKARDLKPFQVAVKVAADGGVLDAVADSEMPVPVCVRDKLKGTRLPGPPRADYWIVVKVNLSH